MAAPPQYQPTFQSLQQQGQARPPKMPAVQQGMPYQSATGQSPQGWGQTPGQGGQAPGQGQTPGSTPAPAPAPQPPQPQVPPGQHPTYGGPQIDPSHPGVPGGVHLPPTGQTPQHSNQPPPFQQVQNWQQQGAGQANPNLQGMWQQLWGQGQHPGSFQGGGGANFQPGGYQGPGNFNGYQGSNFQGPQVQQQGHFQAPQGGQQVDQANQQSVLQALMNPSRYGSDQAKSTFDVLNRQLTQQGNADYQRINEDMASRGLYNSTTAGGRLGDLATNLGNQRADFATTIANNQAQTYGQDRAQAIQQAMGYGGQQFQQGAQGFGLNQQAGQQRYDQQMGAGQFGLQQNAQNFGQQAQQYGLNQGEAMNKYNAGLNNAQFGLQQQGQNYGQQANTFGLNQAANQQGFNQQLAGVTGLQNYGQQGFQNQLATAGFNAQQDQAQTQMWLQMLGMT